MKITDSEIELANRLGFRVPILQILKNETQCPIYQGIIYNTENEPIGFKNSVVSKSNKIVRKH
jgi:hypothetical protein